MAPLKDKLKVLTLNAHSLLEWDAAFCLDSLTDAIVREDVDVVELGLDTKGTETLVDGELARMPLPMTSGRRMKPLMRDYRLYLNAIREIMEQMQDAGLSADMRVNTGRAAVDVRISIPIFTGRK